MTREVLSELLARVEKAEGPDRYVDCWIACALDGFFPVLKEWPGRDGTIWRVDLCCYRDGGRVSPGHGGDQMVQPYTASLDQALALVERMLPGWGWELATRSEDDHLEACVQRRLNDGLPFIGICHTPALALLAALLKALITQAETTGGEA